jgi:hypothetical protein
MDLFPALGGGGAFAVLQGHPLGPAGAVGRDFFPDGFGEQVSQVPAVADLHRARQGPADRF